MLIHFLCVARQLALVRLRFWRLMRCTCGTPRRSSSSTRSDTARKSTDPTTSHKTYTHTRHTTHPPFHPSMQPQFNASRPVRACVCRLPSCHHDIHQMSEELDFLWAGYQWVDDDSRASAAAFEDPEVRQPQRLCRKSANIVTWLKRAGYEICIFDIASGRLLQNLKGAWVRREGGGAACHVVRWMHGMCVSVDGMDLIRSHA